MRLTRRQLRKLINESFELETLAELFVGAPNSARELADSIGIDSSVLCEVSKPLILKKIGFTTNKELGLTAEPNDYDDMGPVFRAAAMYLGHVDGNGAPDPEKLFIMGEDDAYHKEGFEFWAKMVQMLKDDSTDQARHDKQYPEHSFRDAGIAYIKTGNIYIPEYDCEYKAVYTISWAYGTIYI